MRRAYVIAGCCSAVALLLSAALSNSTVPERTVRTIIGPVQVFECDAGVCLFVEVLDVICRPGVLTSSNPIRRPRSRHEIIISATREIKRQDILDGPSFNNNVTEILYRDGVFIARETASQDKPEAVYQLSEHGFEVIDQRLRSKAASRPAIAHSELSENWTLLMCQTHQPIVPLVETKRAGILLVFTEDCDAIYAEGTDGTRQWRKAVFRVADDVP